ncbi:4-hydroxy-tetrahydrodipicolinate synthase [Nocardioides luteus]|uniref:4-hydroxy-tetrahydrodipicolinate synthase n=1 Tax=Nocardioides luteus TaxID=1844 RepID=A0ABQ5SRB7_9ACTN|nr:4-hydroxy-tetrahydrodipicolinate synthase [Nocardioides luteus]MDR7311151.1 4-hydroxy-tetrahydrodipicolinate synthase [Nocardioides luteus]GGR62620.1 4-hydroxy-tetrahydrodipicolinate synthase [Nocardioides luteus]GLJ66697.1 4-hydroxy-tetrahydrodipicolinate synthase [Nocardioides luteus]
MTDAPFGTVLSALVTIFNDDGSVDLEQTQKVAKHLVEHGHDGLVVSGTTGESPTTTPDEDGEILAAVKDAVGDRAKIVAGIGTNDTRTTVHLAKQAASIGADGVLLVTPYYSKPGERGIREHFRTVASTSDLPLMLYDVPGRTASPISLETYREAITWDTVVAVKEAAGDFARGTKLLDLGYAIYSGDDALTLAWLAHGAVGVISVAAHVLGDQTRTMIDAFAASDIETARKTYARMLPAIDAIMGVPNYGATTAKAALELTGVIDNRNVRGPLAALDDDEVEALRAGLEASGLL